MKKIISITGILLLLSLSCSKKEVSLCDVSDSVLYTHTDFPIGVAVDVEKLKYYQPYENLVTNQFNSITPENIFKPSYLHPEQDVFYWVDADYLVNYCVQKNKRLHGHTLIWHRQLPNWMLQFSGTNAEWDDLLKTHIQTIVTRFKGKVTSWDVVNEAFNEDGTLRNNIWKQNLGKVYIEKAFRYAHEADPNAKLFYNDYSLTLNTKKRTAVLDFLSNLKFNGVPIDGIGMQMHVSTAFPENSEISMAIDDIWKSDYLVHLSELDVSINPYAKEMASPPSTLLERQADKMAFIMNAYRQIPFQYQYGITFWGVSDIDSWIRDNRDDYPLLFDDNYTPKSCYCKLINIL